MNELDQYLDNLGSLMHKLEPAKLQQALREISGTMRKRNQERIKQNIAPDGKAFPDRQTDKWQLRKLRTGETLSPRHKIAFMKKRNIKLAYVRDESSTHYVGREAGSDELHGFYKPFIRIHRGKAQAHMFKKMLKFRWLKMKVEARQASIGFMGGFVAKMASEHQYGVPNKRLPSRTLLGFSQEDLSYMEDVLLRYLSEK